ncbi:MAG: 30S ribosomal protein S6 [Christensenellaceae bacterium]|jgi:small subunit ribosomal protein S6|nr:30S ribosomal protein S6 [Christensenellaceae bacterium]
MNKYQLLFIIDDEIEKDAKTALIDKFSDLITSLDGTIDSTEQWGKRTLTYPIDRKTKGYYVLINFTANANVPAEIDRQMRINDAIMRQMITLQ